MEMKELIIRINFLANKKKTVGLTEAEQAEQIKVRRAYLDLIKGQVKATLDRVIIVDQEQ
ncbi:DUF896 domain-containing protein [Succinispira mobilis]|uniref:DUF896 domain-containing protein n=1 Tax=Succinispira mobilis TaxID=78120 RepID=UPI00037BFCDE|nr:DUF896 domain-containing protein [Succinispira mobilis]